MKIFLSSRADRQLRKLPLGMYSLLLNQIEKLGKLPFPTGVKRLAAREGWRLRVGDYRILYTVNQKRKEIIILSVAHRREAYR